MTINVSFANIPGVKPVKATGRTAITPMSPTARYGVDMLKNALKDIGRGG